MSTKIGNIGEACVKAELLKLGYEVYTGDDGSLVDFVIHRDNGRFKTVEVKTTRCRNDIDNGWVVRIDGKDYKKTKPFDKNLVDFLGVYIEPINKVIIMPSYHIETTSKLTLYDTEINLQI